MTKETDIELLLEQGGLKEHPGVKTALMFSQVTGDTSHIEDFVQLARLRTAHAEQLTPFPSPDADELPESGLFLGKNISADGQSGANSYLPVNSLHRYPHILVGGMSGSGKSWYLMGLARDLIELGEVVWFMDSEGDFIDLAGELGAEKLWVIRHDQLRRNPLEPLPGEDPILALGRLKTVLRETTYMRDGAVNLLSECVHKLYAQRGIFSGSQSYPCLADVYQEATSTRLRGNSRRSEYRETLQSRLGNLLDNMRSTYLCRRGHPIRELASHNIVWDITDLSQSRDLMHFFVADMALWLSVWKHRSG